MPSCASYFCRKYCPEMPNLTRLKAPFIHSHFSGIHLGVKRKSSGFTTKFSWLVISSGNARQGVPRGNSPLAPIGAWGHPTNPAVMPPLEAGTVRATHVRIPRFSLVASVVAQKSGVFLDAFLPARAKNSARLICESVARFLRADLNCGSPTWFSDLRSLVSALRKSC